MKLEKLIIENFRGYQGRIEISFDDLTALIGRNDVGKTTVLDALGVFFGHRLCKYDISDKCVYSAENDDVIIGCVFSDLPENLILDAAAQTSLNSEFLLNNEGHLELHKIFKKGKGSGKKDACYNKVKSRYDVWPSAYASGALVKCRKVGAANWGNSSKNEEYMSLPEFTETQIKAMRKSGIEVEVVDESCWKGYGKKYPNCVKKESVEDIEEAKVGSMYQVIFTWRGKMSMTKIFFPDKTKPTKDDVTEKINAIYPGAEVNSFSHSVLDYDDPYMDIGESTDLQELVRTKVQSGNMYRVIFGWRGQMMMIKLFFPDKKVPPRKKVAQSLDKIYPGAILRSYSHTPVNYEDPYVNVGVDEETIQEEKKEKEEKYCRLCRKKEERSKCAYGPKMFDKYSVDDVNEKGRNKAASESGISEASSEAWQRKEGKSKSGGLNEKGRKSYERSNPGSDLKAPSKKVGNPRRASFCARMKGMKKKLTSSKTANDPDSRINKSLRAWNC